MLGAKRKVAQVWWDVMAYQSCFEARIRSTITDFGILFGFVEDLWNLYGMKRQDQLDTQMGSSYYEIHGSFRRLCLSSVPGVPKKKSFIQVPLDACGSWCPCSSSRDDTQGSWFKVVLYPVSTWRIIPFSKWLIAMVSKSPK